MKYLGPPYLGGVFIPLDSLFQSWSDVSGCNVMYFDLVGQEDEADYATYQATYEGNMFLPINWDIV